MADNGGHLEECNALNIEKKVSRLSSSRVREQRMSKTKDKVEAARLPTPPPDPWRMPESLQGVQSQAELTRPRSLEEEDIIAYLTDIGNPHFGNQTSECPSRNSVASTMAVTTFGSDEVFEHLDRLYGLAEETLELRSRSMKLFKRVRDIEKLKALRNADRRLENIFANSKDLMTDFSEEDTGFAESLLDAMLSNCRDLHLQRRCHRSPSARRRSRSLGLSEQSLPRLSSPVNRLDTEKATLRSEHSNGAPKVSKWTRVKAAFKWEKACTNDIIEGTDNTTALSTPTTKYLRIPEVGIGNWGSSSMSPCSADASGPSTPLGRISSASSSNEGSYNGPRKDIPSHLNRQSLKARDEAKKDAPNRRSRSLDGDIIVTNLLDYIERPNEACQGRPLIHVTSDKDSAMNVSKSVGQSDQVKSKRPTPTLTITIPANDEEFRSISSPESISPLPSGGNSPQQMKRSSVEEPTTPRAKMDRQDSKWNKVRRAFLSNAAFSVPPSPVRIDSRQSFHQDVPGSAKAFSCSGSVEDLEKSSASNNQADTRRDYQVLREKFGPEFHRKLVEWENLKSATRNARECVSSGNAMNTREGLLLLEERLAPEFKKKLQDWKRAKKGRRGSATIEQQKFSRRRLTDWQLWRSPSKPEARYLDTSASRGSCGSAGSAGSNASEGKPHLCEDFIRRMEAWRRMNDTSYRGTETKRSSNRLGVSSGVDESEFLVLDRILPQYGDKFVRERRETDSRQLDDKFDGDVRLIDGSPTVHCGNEILIQTSVGSYRFEGISREFTRKLYDWEKYRGISPRSSTFRLLGPGYSPYSGEADMETQIKTSTADKIADEERLFHGVMIRSKSAGCMVDKSIKVEPLNRRFASLQPLEHLAKRLNDTDRTDTSLAPMNSQRAEDVCEDAVMDDSEPEAMIVDIEDVIEETASPLKRVQPHQTPVYSVAASETTSIAVPLGTVTSSHEPSPAFLVEVEENSNRKDWQYREWKEHNSTSNENSPSPEYFEASKCWNERLDALPQDAGNSESSTLSAPWNEIQYEAGSSSGSYKFKEWDDRADCAVRNTNIDSSISSADSHQKNETVEKDEDENRTYVGPERDEILVVSSCGENDEIVWEYKLTGKTEVDKANENPTEQGMIFCLFKNLKETMDLSGAKNQEVNADASSPDEGSTIVDDDKTDGGNKKMDTESPVRSPSPLKGAGTIADSADTRKTFSMQALKSPAESKAERIERSVTENPSRFRTDNENHYETLTATRYELDTPRLSEIEADLCFHKVRQKSDELMTNEGCSTCSSSYEDYGSHSRKPLMQFKSFENTEQKKVEQYHNYESISTSFLHPVTSVTNLEYQREPTIQTTSLTVASSRDERCLERIIINEKTLTKIVVPTNIGDKSKLLTNLIEPGFRKAPLEERDRDTSLNREANSKKADSTTRSVFVKTKRMIFSPFRRTEDATCRKEGDASDDDHRSRSKRKSKSRSTSPKITRQDMLLRMPLSLPWPLRPPSRDRAVKIETRIDERSKIKQGEERRTLMKKGHQRAINEEERSAAFRNIIKCVAIEASMVQQVESQIVNSKDGKVLAESLEESRRLKDSVEQNRLKVDTLKKEVNAIPSDTEHEKLGSGSSSSRDNSSLKESENEMEASLKSDPLSSDLMHKLKILSNAAARRDGRSNTIFVDSHLESHSARIRRAKENFLSRRSGPLFNSLLSSQISEVSDPNPSMSSTNHYEPIENREHGARINEITMTNSAGPRLSTDGEVATGQKEEATSPTNEDNLGAGPRSDISNSSRPDLVKSASVGMINIHPDTLECLTEPNRGCESLPRTISKRRSSSGPLSKIVNKLRLSRLIRGKDSADENMTTISKLCRQSLMIHVQSDVEEHGEAEGEEVTEERPKDPDKTDNTEK